MESLIPQIDPAWDSWWARHHPWDWWAKERGGQPLPTFDRLCVAQLARDAYEAGKRASLPQLDGKTK